MVSKKARLGSEAVDGEMLVHRGDVRELGILQAACWGQLKREFSYWFINSLSKEVISSVRARMEIFTET